MKLQTNSLEHTRVDRSPTGGLNERIEGRYDLLEFDAMSRLAAVQEYGTNKYGPINWRLDPPSLHVKHAIGHLFRWLKMAWLVRVRDTGGVPFSTDGKDDELAHAMCRIMFAIVTEMQTDEELEYVRQMEGVEL